MGADGLRGILDALGDSSDLPSGAPGTTAELVSLKPGEKAAKAYDLRMRGISVAAIARGFGVDVSTVYRWLAQHVKEFQAVLEGQTAANIITETLLFLSRIEDICMYEIAQTEVDSAVIDEKTGAVVRPPEHRNSPRVKYIRAALQARQMKVDVMLETGVLPRQPEKLEHTMKGATETTAVVAREDRSTEQIRLDVEQLLKGSRVL